ncbi:MAG TPA: hypothetical protein VMB05_08305 [Solirubrobacteraceae bacterium]|nr:hypothetical protein [Solirubrobacteraceae bacterium]
MNKLVAALTLAVVGLTILATVGPTLTKVISALVWLVVAIGLVVCLVRVVWTATRRW